MSAIRLKNSHLLIDAYVAQVAFGDDSQVSLVYYPERDALLVVSKSKGFFEKMHKTHWAMLKARNGEGDKSIGLRDILIDHDLDDSDRDLTYELKNTGIVSIRLT